MIPARSINSRNMISVSIEKKVGVSLQPYFIPVVDVILVSSPCALMPSRLPASRAATRRERGGEREKEREGGEKREERRDGDRERDRRERKRERRVAPAGACLQAPGKKKRGRERGTVTTSSRRIYDATFFPLETFLSAHGGRYKEQPAPLIFHTDATR